MDKDESNQKSLQTNRWWRLDWYMDELFALKTDRQEATGAYNQECKTFEREIHPKKSKKEAST